MILGKKGVSPYMQFSCKTCGDVISGKQILDGEYLYIVKQNRAEPLQSEFRCECCQDDYIDQQIDEND